MDRKKWLFAALMIVSFVAVAQSVIPTPPPPPVTLPPVNVQGVSIGGGTLLCTGEACGWVLSSMQNEKFTGDLSEYASPQDVPVSEEDFCNKLRANRPNNFSMTSPPPSPGLSSSWAPNGCGSGDVSNALANAVQNTVNTGVYSGDLDAPYQGVSFRNACNGHDKCYSEAMDKGSCDMSFFNDMMAGCALETNSAGRSSCEGFAGSYFGAVSNSMFASVAAITAAAERTCALWVYDMQNNGCGASQ